MSENVRQRDAIFRPLAAADKVIQDHMIVTIGATGIVSIANNTDTPYACTTKTTKSKRKQLIGIDEFDVGADVPGDIKVTRTGLVDLALGLDHAVLVPGDKLTVSVDDDGTVDKGADAWGTNDHLAVATCEENVAVSAGGGTRQQATVKGYLNFVRYGGM